MKVTKIVKEYVEQAIDHIYNPLIDNCDKEYMEKKDKVKENLEKMTSEFDALAKKMIKENGFSINTNYNSKQELCIIGYTCNFGDKEYSPIDKKIEELINERDLKAQEILATLELGGTKAELDEMLKKIKEEVVG